ncbi:MAG TPA: hypothetical protein VFX59_17805 [Polyangiales bacterium]|nr:hypothetical protein [Polyangiales bacterium]
MRFYWFVASANLDGAWPTYMNYHDLLAEGFRAGQLHVPVAPHRELLTQADPFDPVHIRLWLWDVTLYRARYYMYWGPVPALLQAAVKAALGIDRLVGDQYIVFAAFSLCALAGALLIERVQRRLFTNAPLWLVLLAIAAFGCANPVPYLLATAGTYQASIAAAQAFLLIGLVFAADAVWQRGSAAVYLLPAAGLSWALSLGSRVSTGAAIGALILLVALARSWRDSPFDWRVLVRDGLLMGGPVALCGAALLLYNRLRFDDWFNFGTDMMLTTFPFRLSAEYVLVNLYSYALRPFSAHCDIPFVSAPWAPPLSVAMPATLSVPAGYQISEPLVGWIRVVPATWFIPVALVGAYRSLRRSVQRLRAEPRDVYSLFSLAAFSLLVTLTGMATLGLYFATMRYLSDVTSGLMLLGAMGALALVHAAHRMRWRLPALGAAGLAMLATIAFGVLLGFEGYNKHFKLFNPQLAAHLQQTYSLCD